MPDALGDLQVERVLRCDLSAWQQVRRVRDVRPRCGFTWALYVGQIVYNQLRQHGATMVDPSSAGAKKQHATKSLNNTIMQVHVRVCSVSQLTL